MPTYFPQLGASAIIAQRPYATTAEFWTSRNDLSTGRRHAYANWDSPLLGFDVNYSVLTDAELTTLEAFFAAREGRLGEFTFLDPSGNLVAFSEAFSDASWTRTGITVGAAQADPFGGSLAFALASGVADGYLWTPVLPDGAATGFVLCGSVWVKAQSAGQNLRIGFTDGALALLGSTTHALPQSKWVRIQHTITLGTNDPIRFIIGGNSTWDLTTIHVFGAQVVPMRGTGGYAKSPGNYGLHAKCRFDTDDLTVRYVGPNHNAVRVPVREYK